MSKKNLKNLIINWFILLTLPVWVIVGVIILTVKGGLDKGAFITGERSLLHDYIEDVVKG